MSIALAGSGYAVIGVGPEYAFDLDPDINQFRQLVAFARAGQLPGVDGRRIVLLGGSYSSMHVQRLLRSDQGFRGAVLLGGISDLFELRKRFVAGSFFPPYGLDQALMAMGLPNTAPEHYWRYSSRFHLHPTMPPLLLLHSRDDEIVPFRQSELLAAQLEEWQIAHEAHFFAGMSHYLRPDEASSDLDRIYEITTSFLEWVLS
ncbi:MAG: prolyl oligopeptidase family serine peptidase [Chloroflexaceae bacterium]|nr:prolyl oligopeptidase family serine peptidase [Chloroflexaceae bacterium]